MSGRVWFRRQSADVLVRDTVQDTVPGGARPARGASGLASWPGGWAVRRAGTATPPVWCGSAGGWCEGGRRAGGPFDRRRTHCHGARPRRRRDWFVTGVLPSAPGESDRLAGRRIDEVWSRRRNRSRMWRGRADEHEGIDPRLCNAAGSPLRTRSPRSGDGLTARREGVERLPAQRPHELRRVESDGFGHLDELDDVETTFTVLVLGHERLRPVESGGELRLRQGRVRAHFPHQLPEQFAPGSEVRSRHAPFRQRIPLGAAYPILGFSTAVSDDGGRRCPSRRRLPARRAGRRPARIEPGRVFGFRGRDVSRGMEGVQAERGRATDGIR